MSRGCCRRNAIEHHSLYVESKSQTPLRQVKACIPDLERSHGLAGGRGEEVDAKVVVLEEGEEGEIGCVEGAVRAALGVVLALPRTSHGLSGAERPAGRCGSTAELLASDVSI